MCITIHWRYVIICPWLYAQGERCDTIREPFKVTTHTQHASRWRMRASQTCRLRLLVLLADSIISIHFRLKWRNIFVV